MHTPSYFGSIGVMNAPHLYPARRTLPGRVAGLFAAVGERLSVWYERSWSRAQLARLDDRMLADIGLVRADLVLERDKPVWRA